MSRMISYCANCNGMWLSSEESDEEHCSDQDHELTQRCSLDTIGRCVEGSLIDVWFNVYDITEQVYGGPEEGGWMKTLWQPIASVKLRGRIVEQAEDVGGVESGPRLQTWFEIELDPEDKELTEGLTEMYADRLKYEKHGREYCGHDIVLGFSPGQYRAHPPYYC